MVDRELSQEEQQQLEQHLSDCPDCTVELNRQRMAQSALRRLSASISAPPDLQQRIESMLAQSERRARVQQRVTVLGGVAAALVLAVFAAAGWYRQTHPIPSTSAVDHTVQAHQQRTNGSAPVSLTTSNASEVTSWARATSDKHFDVPSLDAAGFHLVGARPEPDVSPRAVTLVYEGSGTRLTCTVLPIADPLLALLATPPSSPAMTSTVDGSNVASWRDGDSIYILVADLDPATLLRLARLAAQSG